MLSKDKRRPAFEDLDLMPFDKHLGQRMQDIPPSYLEYLWTNGLANKSLNTLQPPSHEGTLNNLKVANYIFNSKEAIEQELGHQI